jgi:DNA topoisomerase-3
LKYLVIAEKPSVSKSIAKVIGAYRQEDGYLEGGDCVVSWCLGHLAEYAAPEHYDERYENWRFEDLPILPVEWKLLVHNTKKPQFNVLRKLLRSKKFDYVVNACDAGREGEAIFRRVYALAGSKLPIKRLWISSMEDAAIQQGFENLRDGAAYDNLFAASECRAKADWLIGMNGTRAFTKKYGRKQTIGRVQTPTLAMLTERQTKIQNFVKEPYYKVELSGGDMVAVSEQMAQEHDADTMQAACDGQCAVVGSIERKRVEKKPPKLYDLTTLQREANRYYGLTASQTLQALQELYEEKLVTYPRTDSQFVTEDMRKTVESLVLALDGQTVDVSCVINNSKVTDHHAILPTMQGAKCNKEKLSETKQKILSLIIWKLLQAVQPPFIYEDVLVTVCCQGRNFTAKYKDVLQPGYTAKPVPFAEPEKDKDVPLPKKMEQGMVLPVVRAEKKQGFTSPPKVYTEDTLLSAMETAGNKEFEKDTEKKGLGTPATRAAILEKLVSSGYVERKGKQMIPTEDGVAAIRNIPDYLKSASMTAEWENDLLRMERGEIKPHDFMQSIHGLLDKMLADLRQIPTVAAAPYHNKVSVGNCPVCGNPVHESKLSFCCADRSCKFALWKESRYLANMRKTLDKKMAVDLLKKGRTHVKDFYSVKKDKTFAADLVMRVEEGRAQYSLEFPKAPMKTKT